MSEAKSLFKLGKDCFNSGNYPEAINNLSKALNECDKDPELEINILLLISKSYFKEQQYENTLKHLDRIFMRYPSHPEGNLLIAEYYLEERDISKTLQHLKRINTKSSPFIEEKVKKTIQKIKDEFKEFIPKILDINIHNMTVSPEFKFSSINVSNTSDLSIVIEKISFGKQITVSELSKNNIPPNSKANVKFKYKYKGLGNENILNTKIHVTFAITDWDGLRYAMHQDVRLSIAERFFGESNQYILFGEPIGWGTYSEVYKAQNIVENRIVALKIFKNISDLNIFKSEISNWKGLNSKNIVKIYDFGEIPKPYIEMEFCNSDLKKELEFNGTIDTKKCIGYMNQVLNGLKDAHNIGIIHRDIKPENILIKSGEIKITDWGLSKPKNHNSTVGLFKGTMNYSAPEQFGKNISTKTDIWQFGVVFYQLLTGKLPFMGESDLELMASISKNDVISPEKLNPNVPLELSKLIIQCLEKAPEKRPSIDELICEINSISYRMRKPEMNNTESKIIYLGELLTKEIEERNVKETYNDLISAKKYIEKETTLEKEVSNVCESLKLRIDYGIEKIPEELVPAVKRIIRNMSTKNFEY